MSKLVLEHPTSIINDASYTIGNYHHNWGGKWFQTTYTVHNADEFKRIVFNFTVGNKTSKTGVDTQEFEFRISLFPTPAYLQRMEGRKVNVGNVSGKWDSMLSLLAFTTNNIEDAYAVINWINSSENFDSVECNALLHNVDKCLSGDTMMSYIRNLITSHDVKTAVDTAMRNNDHGNDSMKINNMDFSLLYTLGVRLDHLKLTNDAIIVLQAVDCSSVDYQNAQLKLANIRMRDNPEQGLAILENLLRSGSLAIPMLDEDFLNNIFLQHNQSDVEKLLLRSSNDLKLHIAFVLSDLHPKLAYDLLTKCWFPDNHYEAHIKINTQAALLIKKYPQLIKFDNEQKQRIRLYEHIVKSTNNVALSAQLLEKEFLNQYQNSDKTKTDVIASMIADALIIARYQGSIFHVAGNLLQKIDEKLLAYCFYSRDPDYSIYHLSSLAELEKLKPFVREQFYDNTKKIILIHEKLDYWIVHQPEKIAKLVADSLPALLNQLHEEAAPEDPLLHRLTELETETRKLRAAIDARSATLLKSGGLWKEADKGDINTKQEAGCDEQNVKQRI